MDQVEGEIVAMGPCLTQKLCNVTQTVIFACTGLVYYGPRDSCDPECFGAYMASSRLCRMKVPKSCTGTKNEGAPILHGDKVTTN
eukprot:6395830-Amphidinium_carterae.1